MYRGKEQKARSLPFKEDDEAPPQEDVSGAWLKTT
jgi:hypothetical protein